MLSKTLFYLLPFVLAAGCPYDRCNSEEGPSTWPVHPSPINLCGASTLSTTVRFETSNYAVSSHAISYDPLNMAFVLNGAGPAPILKAIGLPSFITTKSFTQTRLEKSYKLEKIFCHVGRGGRVDEGSEHYIEGKQFTGELQFVHYDTKFTSYEAAVKSGDLNALLVASVPLQVGSKQLVPLALVGLVDGLLKAILALLSSLLGSLKTGGLPLIQTIPIVNQLFGILGTVIDTETGVVGHTKIVPGFVPTTLVGPLQNLLPTLAIPAAVDLTLSPVTSVLAPTLAPIAPTLNAVVVPLSPTLNAILGPLSPLLNNLIIALAPALGPLLCGLGNLLNTLLAPLGLGGLLGGLLGTLNSLLAPLLASILTPVGMLLNGLLGPIVSPLLCQLLGSLVPSLDSVLTPVVGTVGNLLIPVTTISGSLLTQLSGTLGVALGPFTAVIGGLVQTTITLVTSTITSLTGALGAKAAVVLSSATTLLNLNQLVDVNAPFYVYPGSLTSHPFSPSSVVVFNKPCIIDTGLLNELWKAHGTLAKKFSTQSLGDLEEFGNYDVLHAAGNRSILAQGLVSSRCTTVSQPHWTC